MKMKYFSIILLLSLALAGCQTTQPTILVNKNVVVLPDEALYNCPLIKNFPDPDKLTDKQVAKLLITSYKNNAECKRSIDGIKKFLEDSKRTIESEHLNNILNGN
jgi:uncharacterized protein YcfL